MNLVLKLVASLLFLQLCRARELCVQTKEVSGCKSLSYYVQNVREFFTSNTSFIFHPGIHILESNEAIDIVNVTNFTFQGSQLDSHNKIPAIIKCTGSNKTGFYFRYSSYIHLEKIAVLGCGFVLPHKVPLVSAALAFDHVHYLTIFQITVNYSVGFGLHADHVVDSAEISESVFSHNEGNNHSYGGNVRIWYHDCIDNSTTHQLSISKSWFLHGFDIKKKTFYSYASGLTLLIDCPNVNICVDNITALNNSADNGGNIAIRLNFTSFGKSTGRVVLNNSLIGRGRGHRGGGLRVWSMSPSQILDNIQFLENTILEVVNTFFFRNQAKSAGGALYISHYEHDHEYIVIHRLNFTNCTFSFNSIPAFGNGAVTEIIKHRITGHRSYFSPQFDVNFSFCNFSNNWIILDNIEIVHGAIIDIFSVSKINFHNCDFTNNNSTAISAVGSNIIFSEELRFENNSAVNGGAIKFCDTSVMYITNNTHILFKGNQAKFFGGAIYAQQRCLETATPCFFQPDVQDFTHIRSLNNTMKLTFQGNKANGSGNAVYGGSIDVCYTFQHFLTEEGPSYYHSGEIFNILFHVNGSDISSDPFGVCLCHPDPNIKNCYLKELNLTHVYPGKEFTIYAVPIGQRNGLAPAIIHGELLGNSDHTCLKPNEANLLKQSGKCKQLNYSIDSNQTSVSFILTAITTTFLEESFYHKFQPPKITVYLQPCPWGYVMTISKGQCMCDHHLDSDDITCSNKYQTIFRRGTVWLGKSKSLTNEETDSCLLVNEHCPYGYCKLQNTSVTTSTIDDQCNYNRTGILCGACANGSSVILGGPECYYCSDITILLVFVFALMGIFLVLILILLNLTVTEGTINGIIFYANIVQINREVYFPNEGLSIFVSIPMTIISWLNLDFGIRTCFYRDMDMFAKAALQYVFPIYIWSVVIVIVLLSKRYKFARKLIGTNSVQILATLFLLSMAKLGHAVILSISNTVIMSSQNKQYNVWLADGNIFYLQGKHIFLFTLGVFFFILITTFTCLVTMIQCIQRAPNILLFSYIIRLKPLLDAYTGPYKIRYRFWTGFLLLVRITLFTLLSLNDLNDKGVKLSIIAFACFFLLFLQSAFHGVYIRKELDALEASYILNLGMLSVLSYLLHGIHKGPQWTIIASSVSVSIALFEFACILAYKRYISIWGCTFLKSCFASLKRSSYYRHSEQLPIASNRNSTLRRRYSTLASTTHTEIAVTPDEASDLGPDPRCLQIPPFVDYSSPREPLLNTATN